MPDSYGGVGGMRDLQMSYIFKKSLACFCAAVWCLVKNEALVSHLLLLLLVWVARQAGILQHFWKPGLMLHAELRNGAQRPTFPPRACMWHR